LHDATKLAARAGAVVYSVDMRGNFIDSTIDASNKRLRGHDSRHGGVELGEVNGTTPSFEPARR